jgi:hypothetical protein
MKLLPLLFISLSLPITLLAMRLDEVSLKEFIANKRIVVEAGQKAGITPENNNLCAAYNFFVCATEGEIASFLVTENIQTKIDKLYTQVSAHPHYKMSLAYAHQEKTSQAWRNLRDTTARLLHEINESKGLVLPKEGGAASVLEANRTIDDLAAEWAIAESFLIYHARELERKSTGKDLPPMVIK